MVTLIACDAGGGYEKAENAQDAGRQFIRASLDGDHQKARFYLLQDTTNLLMIERQQRAIRVLAGDVVLDRTRDEHAGRHGLEHRQ